VREARGEDAARRLEGLKKDDMAKSAESLLAGSGWLPESLRTPGRPVASAATSEPTADGKDTLNTTIDSPEAEFRQIETHDPELDHGRADSQGDNPRGAELERSRPDEDAQALAAAE
jgi:ParB family chromosome partitioning protein